MFPIELLAATSVVQHCSECITAMRRTKLRNRIGSMFSGSPHIGSERCGREMATRPETKQLLGCPHREASSRKGIGMSVLQRTIRTTRCVSDMHSEQTRTDVWPECVC